MSAKNRSRAVTALFMVLALVMSLLPAGALAAESAPTAATTFTFTNDGVTAAGETAGYKIEGTALTIEAPGVYAVTGSCAEGSIKVKKETTGVTLILNGLTLSSSKTAPLSCNKSTQTTLYLLGTNTLTDKEDPANETSTDEAVADAFEGAAVKVKAGASLTVTGTGTLNADGSACKNGVKGGATSTITVESGTLNITAANNGLAADGELRVQGGTVNVAAENDGLKAEPDEGDADSAGTITITGGTVKVTKADDAIHATNTVTVTGGTLDLTCADDAIHSEYDVVLGTQGASAGPTITVRSCSEGFEGARVFLNSGTGTVNSSDDGVNAATDQAVSELSITVNGGAWLINARGDALDAGGNSRNNAGGNLLLNGGTVEAVSTGSGNGALDFDGTCVANGTTLLAVGSDMAQTPTTGAYVLFGSGMGGMNMGGMGRGGMGSRPGSMGGATGSQPTAGSVSGTLTVRDSSGNTLYTSRQSMSGSYAIFTAPGLTSGQTYTLNNSLSATASAGSGSAMGPGGQQGQPGQQGPGGQTPPEGQPAAGEGDPALEQPADPAPQEPAEPEEINKTPFTDVPDGAWYTQAVNYAYETGLMSGVSATQFHPAGTLTRAMLCQILYNLAGDPAQTETSGFEDVKATSWYSDAVTWARNAGIIAGYDSVTFGPNDPVTRAQTAVILRNYAALVGQEVSAASTPAFADAHRIPRWAEAAVAWAVEEGLLQGNGQGLDPTGTATRAQIASIFQRFLAD